MNRKYYFLFVLPVLWACVSVLQYRFPGDEYGLYAVGSAVGTWIYFLVPPGDVNRLLFPLIPAVTGVAVMAVAGWVLDWLRGRRLVFWITWIVSVTALFLFMIFSYPSLDKAISKNGSLWAYLLAAVNMGVYAAGGFTLLAALLTKIWKRLKSLSNKQSS